MTKKFAIVKGDLVDCIALAESPLDTDGKWIDLTGVTPQPGPGWKYDGTAFAPPPAPVDTRPPVITKVAFRFRLTDAEYVGILTAAKSDITVAAWVETFNMVNQVDLNNQRTKDGVANLVAKNLLTQPRATAILTDPVQEGERP